MLRVVKSNNLLGLLSRISSSRCIWAHHSAGAKQVEGIVRDNGATPATIAVLDGDSHIGLTAEQLHRIASGCGPIYQSAGSAVWCAGRLGRSLAFTPARCLAGAVCLAGSLQA